MTLNHPVTEAVRRALAVGAIVLLGAGSLVAHATPAPAPAPAPAQKPQPQTTPAPVNPPVDNGKRKALETIVVTGSYIPGSLAATPNPIQVISLAQMKRSGFTTAQQVLQQLTANGQGQLSQSFSGAFASGAAGVALRGLSVAYTLVLIDGHRTAPYPIGDDGERTFVDVANLPFDAIKSIQVLKDGASAIYGSDAIAGVVNIITRKTFQGAQVTADGGMTSHEDGSNYRVGGLFGIGDLDTSGHNAYIDLEFRKQNPILFADRGSAFTNYDFRPVGGIDNNYGVPNSQNGGFPAITTGYVVDPNTSQIAGFMPGCTPAQFTARQCIVPNTWSQIQPPTKTIDALGRVTQDLGANWQASLEASYFESTAEQVNYPESTQPTGWQGLAIGPGTPPTLMPPGAATTIPSTNPSYPSGVSLPSALLYYSFGPGITETDSKDYRAVLSLHGSIGKWNLRTAAGYTEDDLRVIDLNYPLLDRLQSALDSATNPYLVGQINSSSVLNYIMPATGSNDVSQLSFVHLGAERPVLRLDGGDLAVAFGADYYTRNQHALAPLYAAEGMYPQGWISNNFTIGRQHVASGYLEINAPLFKQLDVDVAGRYDHYNISGGKFSPKISLKYTPFRVLAFRGTFGKGFRAPDPAENGIAGQTYYAPTIRNPILCPNASSPTAAGNFAGQCSVSVPFVQNTNPNLKPETSTSYTLGVVYSPVPAFTGSFDFYQITIDNQVISGGPVTTFYSTNLSPIPQYQANGTTALVVPPKGPIAYQSIGYINANSTQTNGFDLGLNYRHRFRDFDFRSDVMWSYINKWDLSVGGVTYELAGTHGPSGVSGDTGNPRSRVRWSNSVRVGRLTVTDTLNYISSFSVLDASAIQTVGADMSTCLSSLTNQGGAASQDFPTALAANRIPNSSMCRVPHFTTMDLYFNYVAGAHLSLHGSVLNVFNAGPPNDWATYGGALGLVPWNPSLDLQGAIGTQFMLGVTYRF